MYLIISHSAVLRFYRFIKFCLKDSLLSSYLIKIPYYYALSFTKSVKALSKSFIASSTTDFLMFKAGASLKTSP